MNAVNDAARNEAVTRLMGMTKCVVMHISPHLDEIMAYYLLVNYGGIKASIRFLEGDISGNEADHDAAGILPIGCGTDCRFNEHRKGIERIKGECATTLVAKYLGITELPEVKQLIQEVLECDTKSGCSPTKLAELVKIVNRGMIGNPMGVVNWTMVALKAIIRNQKYPFAALSGEKTLIDLLRSLEKEGKYFDEDKRVREFVFQLMHKSTKGMEQGVTELAAIVRAMYRAPYSQEVINGWLETPLLLMCQDQLEFQRLADEFGKKRMIEVLALGNRGDGILDCLFIESDSLQAPRAARYVGAKVAIVRNSEGNVMVSVDSRLPWLNLTNLTRMIRWMELPFDAKDVEWKSLGIPGTHELVPNWYYYKKAEQLFNGNQSHKAPASGISNQGLIEALKCAFHPRYTASWCRNRGIEWRSVSEEVGKLGQVIDNPAAAQVPAQVEQEQTVLV